MKKITLLIPIFLSVILNAQVAYYDAIKIKKLAGRMSFDEENKVYCLPQNPEVYKILKYYVPIADSSDIKRLENNFDNNPFIQYCERSFATGNTQAGSKSIFSSIAGLDVTNIANGIAQFMIERAKQELTIAFFNRFKKFSDENPEFKVLFPKTADNLQNLLTYKYPEMLPALRTGFFEDLKSITYHLDDVLELPRYQKLLKNFPVVRVAIRSIRIIHEIESGDSHPADVLNQFAEFTEWADTNASRNFRNFGSSVKLAAVFSNSLRKVEEIQPLTDTILSIDTIKIKDTIHSKTTIAIRSRDGSFEKTIILEIKQYPKTEGRAPNERIIIIRDTITTQSETGELKEQPPASPKAWISFKEMKVLVENDTTFHIYLGLLYQLAKSKEIKFYLKNRTNPFTELMKEQKDNLLLFQSKVTEFIELANKVDKILDTLNNKKSNDIALTNDDYYDYIDVSLDVIEYAFSIGKLFNDEIEVEKYCKIARKSNDLYRNIYKQEYTQALTNGIDILTNVRDLINESKIELLDSINRRFNKNIGERSIAILSNNKALNHFDNDDITTVKDLLATVSSMSDKELLNKALAFVESHDHFGKLTRILEKINRYGLFMANLVNADSPEEVSSVLENAALPVGSSSIKKNSAFNISLQSYLGGYRKFGYLEQTNTIWTNKWGVIAPIGVAFSAGMQKGGAFSLFASIFDIGAIVDYQLKKEPDVSTSNATDSVINRDYKVKLGQIFSPGGYFVYGFPYNIPLSFGIGGQYGPGLGKVEAGNTIVNNPQWRWSVFLAVDIPFFNLVNRPKRYKP